MAAIEERGVNIDGTPIMVHDDLATSGAHINGVAGQASDLLQALISKLQPISETWTGTASTYYQGLQSEWNYAANGLFGPEGVLGEIAQAMNVNWNNYSDAEWSNAKTWQQ